MDILKLLRYSIMKIKSFPQSVLIIKSIGFIVPVLIVNFIIVKAGFLYSEKDPELLSNLVEQSKDCDKLNVLFLGTSRTNHDLSPVSFMTGFCGDQHLGNGINLGIDGYTASTSMALFGDQKIDADIVFIELYPGNPMNSFIRMPASNTPSGRMMAILSRESDKFFTLHKLYNILYHIFGSNPVKYSLCHEDGWCEINVSKNPLALAKTKLRLANTGIRTLKDPTSKDDYREYSKKIKTYIDQKKTTVIFIILPVDGTVRYYQSIYFKKLDPVSILKSDFPSAYFIDASDNPLFENYITFDGSHLTSIEAKMFSYKLGSYLADITLTD